MEKFYELIEISARDASQADRLKNAIQRIASKLSPEDILAIDQAMQKDPQIIPKVLKVANNPIVKRLFSSI